MLVAEHVEVRGIAGCLTLRVGGDGGDPVSIVIPGESAFGFLETLDEATRDAEEHYWSVVVPYIRSLGLSTADEMAKAMAKWHRTQRWERAARYIPPEDVMFVLTNVGHVAIGANPPASPHPVLAIFNPSQLHMISPGLIASAHQAQQGDAGPEPWPYRAMTIHDFLGTQPWRVPGVPPSLDGSEAAELVKKRYVDFLRREPHVRSPEHDLPV